MIAASGIATARLLHMGSRPKQPRNGIVRKCNEVLRNGIFCKCNGTQRNGTVRKCNGTQRNGIVFKCNGTQRNGIVFKCNGTQRTEKIRLSWTLVFTCNNGRRRLVIGTVIRNRRTTKVNDVQRQRSTTYNDTATTNNRTVSGRCCSVDVCMPRSYKQTTTSRGQIPRTHVGVFGR